jgi:hypothetical protein
VRRQYTGSAGKITNCQVGVFAAYVSTRHALINSTCPRTGPVIRSVWRRCPRMSSSRPSRTSRSRWLSGRSAPGAVRLGGGGQQGRRGRDGVVPGGQGICARRREQFNSWDKPVSGTAEAIALALPASRWVRLPAGAGGPRLYDWGYVDLANLDARSFFGCGSAQTIWTLLIRLSDGKMAFDVVSKGHSAEGAGRGPALGDRGRRRDRENRACPQRSWHGWHRHVSLVMLAFAMLMVIRHKADTSPQKRPNSEIHGAMVTPGNPSYCLASDPASH